MPSLGEILRTMRESRGLSREELAEQTRIRLRHLEALENDSFHELPGKAFNEGFVRLCAVALEVDPDLLIKAYREEEERQIIAGKLPEPPSTIVQLKEQIERRRRPSERLVDGLHRVAPLLALAGLVMAAFFIVPRLRAWRSDPRAADASPSSTRVEVAAVSDGAAQEPDLLPKRQAIPDEPPTSRPVSEADKPPATGGISKAADPPVQAPEKTVKRSPPNRPPPDRPQPRPARLTSPLPTESLLSVSESGVGSAIVHRELADHKDRFAVGEKVFFWTRVLGGRKGDRIDHVWKRNGRLIGIASLSVGGAHWRTHSLRIMPADCAGSWVVEARDENDRLLATHSFECRQSN